MDCKSCKWLKIYDYKFHDGTKTITCEKYNKHLGFTNKKGQVNGVSAISECEFNNYPRKIEVKKETPLTGRLVFIRNRWNVEVEENGSVNIIYSSKYKHDAMEKLELFRNRKSWITGICYARMYKSWTVKIYVKNKKFKHIGTYKTFFEAKKALREAEILSDRRTS